MMLNIKILKILTVFILLVFLTGCSGGFDPDIKIYNGPTGSIKSNQSDINQSGIHQSGIHRVKKGETLYSISKIYLVPLRALIEKNNLSAPYIIDVNQRLMIPSNPRYIVKTGDSLYAISKSKNVAINQIVKINNLKSPYIIYVGQRLLMPGKLVTKNTKVKNTKVKNTKVKNTKVKNIKQASNVVNPVPRTVKYRGGKITKNGYPRPYIKPREPSRQIRSIAKPVARSSSKFLWPVKGKLISNYGAKGKGLYNDGLNIAAPKGSPVKAAENGVVAYAGSELKGYGNLILLKHADGYLTAYAHNNRNLVTRGQKIKRGQVIAKIGMTGNVDRPQLHFQIRRGKNTVNPARYLTKI